ncbi:hypothetical protein IP92_00181 [Pseudoduganella flava]|uniref:Uncharacterized protein n=1 Tax=Pseudoduganella flava TaxID=871742 RepID=A0A562Q3D5_9BURK|nr:hypothetical protein [Pseudoduganella flava]QGZ41261.1 hypothetical protein GO485_20815 [Pseudoduganella flava]TWI51198.1 hypothetical protein IP92_00181 [Pseudoduganella flava]
MRLLQLILIAAVFLAVLTAPAVLVARGLWRRGYPLAPRCLRVIVPLQVLLALGAVVLGDALGRHELPALIVVATLGTSALGAAAMWAIGALFPARLL